jgi:hypothetical protein
VNPRKYSRLRKIQNHRKSQRLMTRVFEFIYNENREDVDACMADAIVYGSFAMHWDGDRLRRVAVHQESSGHE